LGGTCLYEFKVVADVLKYLSLALTVNRGEEDWETLYDIVNVPPRYLGGAFISKLASIKKSKDRPKGFCSAISMACSGIHSDGGMKFIAFIKNLSSLANSLNPSAMIHRWFVNSDYVARVYPSDLKKREWAKAKLLKLAENATTFQSAQDFLDYVNMVIIDGADGEEEKDDTPKVTLSTIHSSKGMEFDTVFMPLLADGILPHNKALILADKGEKEAEREEKRLMYVGVTRAMNCLYMSYPRIRIGPRGDETPLLPSRYVKEIEDYVGGRKKRALSSAR
jgi:DNA helicase-2/ATP-dependent DNA helicase PcrA